MEVRRIYGIAGPTDEELKLYAHLTAKVVNRYPVTVIEASVEDEDGAVESLDEYMASIGYVYMPEPLPLRIFPVAKDPSPEAGVALLYSKDVGGTTKVVVQDSDGKVTETDAKPVP